MMPMLIMISLHFFYGSFNRVVCSQPSKEMEKEGRIIQKANWLKRKKSRE